MKVFFFKRKMIKWVVIGLAIAVVVLVLLLVGLGDAPAVAPTYIA